MKLRVADRLLLFILFRNMYCIRWMALDHYSTEKELTPELICLKKYGLTFKQIKFCQKHFQWMHLIKTASTDTVNECQDQLNARRWNCLGILKAPKFDSDLRKLTRESAFVYALSAAALALRISNGCMAGTVADCLCRHPKRHVSFSSEIIKENDMSNIDGLLGCKGIVKVGQKFAKTFSDMGYRRKARNERHRKEILLHRHSVDTGLKELTNGEEIACRCNGVTAGCAFQFCHRRIIEFKKVANNLRKKYDTAVKATEDTFQTTKDANSQDSNTVYSIKELYKDKLLYLEEGLNQCHYTNGYQSLSRRQCTLDKTKTNSCEKLCCSRGYQEKIIEIHSQCRCKFVYCCKVVCDTCKSYNKIYECL